jgi:hypothetical protein
MMKQATFALAAAMLLSGAAVASAAGIASSHSGIMPRASDTLSLNSTQQKTAWNDMNKQAADQDATGFNANIGAVVPSALKIESVPSKAARDVPPLRLYDFAMVQGKLLIVNPTDKKVAEVISG